MLMKGVCVCVKSTAPWQLPVIGFIDANVCHSKRHPQNESQSHWTKISPGSIAKWWSIRILMTHLFLNIFKQLDFILKLVSWHHFSNPYFFAVIQILDSCQFLRPCCLFVKVSWSPVNYTCLRICFCTTAANCWWCLTPVEEQRNKSCQVVYLIIKHCHLKHCFILFVFHLAVGQS